MRNVKECQGTTDTLDYFQYDLRVPPRFLIISRLLTEVWRPCSSTNTPAHME